MIIRALTGLGLGGAMPTSIALASEASHPERRIATTATLMAAMPLGGAIAGLIALSNGWWSWREIFYVGGAGPILVGLTVLPFLPKTSATGVIEQPVSIGARTEGIATILFDTSRRRATLLLWVGFFFTQLLLLLMLNWLPSLILGLGFSRTQASLGSVLFNISGAIGANFLSRLHASRWQRAAVLLIYLGVIASLYTLRTAQEFILAAVACASAGVFIVGAQMILFALAPLFYLPRDRATGTGAAVAIGRLGSVVGPGIAGVVLASGGTSGSVLAVMLPFVAIAGSAVLALAWCRRWTQ
jgi:AAHS family 3-hydroxyphenylpropionic acid transporter